MAFYDPKRISPEGVTEGDRRAFARKLEQATATESGCLNWPQTERRAGQYGMFRAESGAIHDAHRFAYFYYHGEMPAGMFILHACDNRSCVSREHLRIGTRRENIAEASERGRLVQRQAHEHQCAVYSEEQMLEVVERIKRGETQGEISAATGVPTTTVKQVRRGKCWRKFSEEHGLALPPPKPYKPHRVAPREELVVTDELREKFYANVRKTDTCWLWTGSGKAYGSFFIKGNRLAHHVSLWLESGNWPDKEKHVAHVCQTPRCVRPDHLRELTPAEHSKLDSGKKKPSLYGSRHNAKLTDDDIRKIKLALVADPQASTEDLLKLVDNKVYWRRIDYIRVGQYGDHVDVPGFVPVIRRLHKLDDETKAKLDALILTGLTCNQLMQQTGLNEPTVRDRMRTVRGVGKNPKREIANDDQVASVKRMVVAGALPVEIVRATGVNAHELGRIVRGEYGEAVIVDGFTPGRWRALAKLTPAILETFNLTDDVTKTAEAHGVTNAHVRQVLKRAGLAKPTTPPAHISDEVKQRIAEMATTGKYTLRQIAKALGVSAKAVKRHCNAQSERQVDAPIT